MSDPFTGQGLQDRSRTFPTPVADAYFQTISVSELIIGGHRIYAKQGTRYANGRLAIEGRGDNSVEIELNPGPTCQTKGVISQIIWYAKYFADSFKRFAISIVNDGTNERVVMDSTSHESVPAMPFYITTGAKSRSDGTDVPGSEKIAFSFFHNGTHEFHLYNDTLRVEMNSFIEAFIANDKSKLRARQLKDGSWQQIVFDNNTSFDEL